MTANALGWVERVNRFGVIRDLLNRRNNPNALANRFLLTVRPRSFTNERGFPFLGTTDILVCHGETRVPSR